MLPNSSAQQPDTATVAANLELTRQFTEAFENRDLEALSSYLSGEVSLVQPLTFSGSATPEFAPQGKAAVLAYFRRVYEIMDRIEFVTTRLSATADGTSVYHEATGDFTTAAGKPYQNVYLLRFDFADGKVAHIAEYANPITFTRTFGAPPEH